MKLEDITDEDFYKVLESLVVRDCHLLLMVPGAYGVFSEHYNNEIIDILTGDQQ